MTVRAVHTWMHGHMHTSCSCIFVAITSILAAGCSTSSSLITVAASLVTNSFSKWFITILFMPREGGREGR